MVHPVALAVDDGLLEAERVDQEPDQPAGVAGAQRGPDLRWWCLLVHANQASQRTAGGAWTFRNSSASHADGGQPGQVAELAGQVGLVVVAAVGGQVGQQQRRLLPSGAATAAACGRSG